MQFYNIKFFIPIKAATMSGGNDNTDLTIAKKYTRQQFWDILEQECESDPSGFSCENKRKPIIKYSQLTKQLKYYNEKLYVDQFQRDLYDSVHIGQRKLLASEIQMLANNLSSYDEAAIVIYAGAAPSCKVWILHQLFPNVKFVLIDPNEFWIYWGEYDKPHYTAVNDNKVVYLSYSNADMYSSINPHWNRKHIRYYDHKANNLVDIKDKEFGRTLSKEELQKLKPFNFKHKRNISNTNLFKVLSGNAQQASFDYILNSDHRIYCLEEYFTDIVAARIANTMENYAGKFYFWTDIRTGVEQGESVSDLDVIWNNAMTYTWMRIMKPTLSMLKFRLPYFASNTVDYNYFADDFLKAKELGCDFIERTSSKKSIPYFAGEIYLQTWNHYASAEARLIVEKKDIIANNLIDWQLSEYENKICYYNTILRFGLYYENDNSSEELGFDFCNNCAIENSIWQAYKAINEAANIPELIKMTTTILRVKIKDRQGKYNHGHLFC